MKLPLAYYGDPILRKKAARVEQIDDGMRQLVSDMLETMQANNGAGLAAPQVHRSVALFLANIDIPGPDDTWLPGKLRVCFNPKIIAVSDEEWEWSDGCLSIPKIWGKIYRPVHVEVEYTNLEGQRIQETLVGPEAWCFMHENDHLNGVLWIDRLKGKARQEIEPQLRAIKKAHNP